jgi:HEAT repeat protein
MAGARALVWPDVADRVERDLSSSDVTARRSAARALVSLGPERGGALSLAAMADADDEVRLAGAQAAIAFRVAGATDAASSWLNASNARLRREACEVARALPSSRTIAPLARSLGDPDPEVRAAAADALGHQRSPEAVAPLLGRLDDSTPSVRIEIVTALAQLGDSRAVVPLVGKVEDSAADVRQAVVRALGDLDDARAAPALVLALRDQSPDVRRAALVALGRLEAPDAVDAIAPFVSDRVASLRLAALEALGRIGTPDALRAMAAALGTGDDAAQALEPTPVRDAFVAAGPSVIPQLRAVLGGAPTPAAATSAAWVLGQLAAHEEAATLVAAMRRGVLPTAAALHALAGAGTTSEVPAVLEFVADASPVVRAEADVAAIALLDPTRPDGRAVEPLAAALRDPRSSSEESAHLALALGRTGASRAAPLLADLARAQDATLRIAAIDALGMLPPGDADGPLLVALRDPGAEVRLHAAMALGRSGTAHARDVLLTELDGPDELDLPALETALGGLMARLATEPAVARLARALSVVAGPDRDGVLEAIGRAPFASAVAVLREAARSGEPLDRCAAAVLAAAHAGTADRAGGPAALAMVRGLLADSDDRVRRQAAWTLGAIGTQDDVPRLTAAARGDDAQEAANATGALARIFARERPPAGEAEKEAGQTLCGLLPSAHALVRANALAGLALGNVRCGDGSAERRALADDPAEPVRAAAALAVSSVPLAEDVRALARCARTDVSTAVSQLCGQARHPRGPRFPQASLVYIVPPGADAPRPGAAYALLLADGLVRVGTADRRGAVFDPIAPEGPLRLLPPGGLSR